MIFLLAEISGTVYGFFPKQIVTGVPSDSRTESTTPV